MELLDGYLLSETFGRGAPDGEGDPQQVLLRVDGSGRVAEVAQRRLGQDFPALSRFAGLWFSPVLDKAHEASVDLFAPRTPLKSHDHSKPPFFIWILASALCLLSGVAAWWWSGRVRLGRARRVGWTAVSTLIGLPAFVSLILFHPRRAERS
jgi:hypothetical protein